MKYSAIVSVTLALWCQSIRFHKHILCFVLYGIFELLFLYFKIDINNNTLDLTIVSAFFCLWKLTGKFKEIFMYQIMMMIRYFCIMCVYICSCRHHVIKLCPFLPCVSDFCLITVWIWDLRVWWWFMIKINNICVCNNFSKWSWSFE